MISKMSIFICLLLQVSLIVGCSDPQLTNTGNEVGQTEEDKTYKQEYDDLFNKLKDNVVTEKSSNINVSLNIDKNDKDGPYIVYNTSLENPKVEMKDVKISFILQLPMIDRLSTPSIFYSNELDKRNVNLDPVTVNKYHVFLALPLKNAKIDKIFLDEYKKILVKVSWKSIDGSSHRDYQIVEGIPSPQIGTYLDSNKK